MPRSSSLPAVASAMKPRIDGTLAAVEAPSRRRVAPSSGSDRRQPGQDDRDAAEDRAVEHDPVVPEPVRQDPEDRRQDQLGQVEDRREQADDGGVDRLAAVLGRSAR